MRLLSDIPVPERGRTDRGRPSTKRARAVELADVRVLSPVARYPRGQPRSYLFRASIRAYAAGLRCALCRLPRAAAAEPAFNGWLCARTLHAPLREFAPDVCCRPAVPDLSARCMRRGAQDCAGGRRARLGPARAHAWP